MALDPAILAYAFFESYLNRRENDEWSGLVKIAAIDPVTFQSDKTVNQEVKQKISLCIDTIRSFSRAKTINERIGLALELANKEEQELKSAAEKAKGYLGIAWLFVNPDPMLAQLLRALRSLVIANVKDKPEYNDYLLKLKVQNADINIPTALELATKETRDNALARQREKESLVKEMEILSADNEYYLDFYNKWIKTDAKASELKEETLEDCLENVKTNKRSLEFCKKVSLAVANVKSPERAKSSPVVAKVEEINPPVVAPKPEPVSVPEVRAVKIPVIIKSETPQITYASKATPLARHSAFAEGGKVPVAPPLVRRERRLRRVKHDDNYIYDNSHSRKRF